MIWKALSESDYDRPMIAFTVAGAVLIGSFSAVGYYYIVNRRQRSNKKEAASDWKKELVDSSSSSSNTSKIQNKKNTDSACAWEERRQRGIAAASSHVKTDAVGAAKPFGSSYYYAHNNTQATGGYKDGLRMEDYTMNGPRLLSRGGKPVVVSEQASKGGERGGTNATEEQEANGKEQNISNTTTTTTKRSGNQQRSSSLPISKYLWDDPGDSKGVATIRIDKLPASRRSGGGGGDDYLVDWKDCRVRNVSAELIQDGLVVNIETTTTTTEADNNNVVYYCLRIPKLYGPVSEVKTVCKEKRLLIRLIKKRGLLDKSNLKAWPHPQKKTV